MDLAGDTIQPIRNHIRVRSGLGQSHWPKPMAQPHLAPRAVGSFALCLVPAFQQLPTVAEVQVVGGQLASLPHQEGFPLGLFIFNAPTIKFRLSSEGNESKSAYCVRFLM